MKVTIALPWPPSANHYWRSFRGHVVISAEGQGFRRRVGAIVRVGCYEIRDLLPITGLVHVAITATPPDRRRRDVDNLLKATLDALTHGGLWKDDSQVVDLRISKLAPCPTRAGLSVEAIVVPQSTQEMI